MREKKWTPGPWTFLTLVDGFTIMVKGAVVCRIKNVVSRANMTREDVANAHLISAAPDLVEALESALKTTEFEKRPFRDWHHEARVALAKAYGEDVS